MRRFLTSLLVLGIAIACPPAARAAAGQHHRVHVLRDARIIVAPGRVIPRGTLVLRDGRIEAVGEHPAVPRDAQVHDMAGKVIHAGFIDPYVTVARLEGRKLRRRGPIRDDDDEEDAPQPDKDREKEAPLHPSAVSSDNPRVHPDWRVSDHLAPKTEAVEALRRQGFVLVQAVPDQGLFRGAAALYSLVGAAPRADLLRDATASVVAFDPQGWPGTYPASMMGNVAAIRQTLADAEWYARARAVQDAAWQGSLRPEAAAALDALQPVLAGRQPVLFEADTLLEVLRAHRVLGEVPALRRVAVLSGEEWRHLDWIRRLTGAEWILPVAFPPAPRAKSEGEWLDVDLLTLRRWRNAPANGRWLDAQGIPFSLTTHRLESVDEFGKAVARAVAAGLPEKSALEALTTRPARLLGVADRFGTLQPGKAASFVVRDAEPFAAGSTVEEVWVEGVRHAVDTDDAPKKAAADKAVFAASDYAAPPVPLAPPAQPHAVVVRGATVWTEGPQGRLEDADLLVLDGKVRAVGKGLPAPAGAVVIDGRGRHVTPGIVDAHSHTAVDGSVNEATMSCSAQVRIKDVLDPFALDIYRQLAGGTTAANVMHGSANAIGGQVVTCKWRWGADPDGLLLAGVPEGIKFALGENPKQSNWSTHDRYPQTRMGVAAVIRERFVAARDYRKAWADFAAGRRAMPPRRDFQLEALLEVLDGKRLIQCHSYRQDEILALMRLAEEEGFKVKTFQHVLEGYKVADEMARHGAMASTFSDWWAYKYEVVDAIPYNGALMHERGVVVSFNSDSDDQARRLNTEAAKAIRYGGLMDEEALAFVTINPARQLGAQERIGSLEPGKDGDFVVWSGHPLLQRSVPLETWIDGRKYFDREGDRQRARAREAERRALLAKARAVSGKEKH